MTQFTYLSLGAGVQSSALLVMSAQGLYDCPRADIAVFADTGDEPQWVYDYLNDHLIPFGKKHGIPVHVAQKGVLSENVVSANGRSVSLPLFTPGDDGTNEGMLRRQCTREFKVEPIEKFVRAHLGYKPRQRIRQPVTCLVGISIDESHRMKLNQRPWITNRWPLVDAELDRRKCLRIVTAAGLPEPKRSACVYCPFHSDRFWNDLKVNHPDEFTRAVAFDRAFRVKDGLHRPGYVHRSCQPLDEVDFDPTRDQIDMFGNECEGMCGV